ncbi:MAG: ATP-binding cassette domain-containing protein [Serratia sp. (in: enterobacteria)]|uniref:ABC transporter ATP-binding protein n=1 Tax=Serratia sp. (in: enterobacteria) TaxID=616 RepID=UPI003F41100A
MNLVINEISKDFGQKQVLKQASFRFEKGKIYGLLGRNGAGKTTLFNCINEDIQLDGGSIYIETANERIACNADRVGYVLSTPVVPDFLTAREFIKFYLDVHQDQLKDVQSVETYLSWVNILPEDQDRLLKDFSHGMKNKIQMLIYFISKPDVLLLDEPLTSFDVVVAEEMKRLLRAMKQDRIIIFSTHIMELALDLCDEIVLLTDGSLQPVAYQDMQSQKDYIISLLSHEGV